jgi:hypothetical protein
MIWFVTIGSYRISAMHKLTNLIPLVLAVAIVGSPVLAQDIASDMDFLGINTIRVTVSPLTIDSIDCNIDGSYLMRELQRQFEADGLAGTDQEDALAVISVLSARESGGGACNSAVMLGAYKKVSFFDQDAAWIRTGYVVVWQSALLVTSAADAHLDLTRDALARLGEAMLKEWQRLNAPSASASDASQ